MIIDYSFIGAKIKEIRRQRGYTQEWLAIKLEVSIGYISQVERGVTKISLDLLGKIAVALECDIAELITGSAIQSGEYLSNEISSKAKLLHSDDKKLVSEFIDILINHKA